MDFTITSAQILSFCGLVTTLFAVWKIIKEIKKPSDDLKDKVENQSRILENHNDRLKDAEHTNKMILQCLLVILNHDITGNGIDKMKEARDELQEYLINK